MNQPTKSWIFYFLIIFWKNNGIRCAEKTKHKEKRIKYLYSKFSRSIVFRKILNGVISNFLASIFCGLNIPIILLLNQANRKSILLRIEWNVGSTLNLCAEEIVDTRSRLENDELSFHGVDVSVVEEFTRSDSYAVENIFFIKWEDLLLIFESSIDKFDTQTNTLFLKISHEKISIDKNSSKVVSIDQINSVPGNLHIFIVLNHSMGNTSADVVNWVNMDCSLVRKTSVLLVSHCLFIVCIT